MEIWGAKKLWLRVTNSFRVHTGFKWMQINDSYFFYKHSKISEDILHNLMAQIYKLHHNKHKVQQVVETVFCIWMTAISASVYNQSRWQKEDVRIKGRNWSEENTWHEWESWKDMKQWAETYRRMCGGPWQLEQRVVWSKMKREPTVTMVTSSLAHCWQHWSWYHMTSTCQHVALLQ